jgi:hypothetical protein
VKPGKRSLLNLPLSGVEATAKATPSTLIDGLNLLVWFPARHVVRSPESCKRRSFVLGGILWRFVFVGRLRGRNLVFPGLETIEAGFRTFFKHGAGGR